MDRLNDKNVIKIEKEDLEDSEERLRNMIQNHHAVMLLINPENGYIINGENPEGSSP